MNGLAYEMTVLQVDCILSHYSFETKLKLGMYVSQKRCFNQQKKCFEKQCLTGPFRHHQMAHFLNFGTEQLF